jgi:hypothetical protein
LRENLPAIAGKSQTVVGSIFKSDRKSNSGPQ